MEVRTAIRLVLVFVVSVAALACDDAGTAVGPVTDTHKGESSDTGASVAPNASAVLLSVSVPGVEGQSVQDAVESLATGLLTLASRVALLEEPTVPPTVVAAEVKFVPNDTSFAATNVQQLGVEAGLRFETLEAAATTSDQTISGLEKGVEALKAELDAKVLSQAETDAEQDAHYQDLGDYVANFSSYADGIDVEHPQTASKDHLFADAGILDSNVTVYEALSIIWGWVKQIRQHHETQCPPEMTPMNDVLCVDKNRGGGTVPWLQAAKICTGLGKRLCRPAELASACSSNAFAPEEKAPGGGIDVLEWTDAVGSDGMAIYATGKNCTTFGGDDPDLGFAYRRCCKDAIPPLPKE